MKGNDKKKVDGTKNSDSKIPRLLGLMFVVVAVLSLSSGLFLGSLGVPLTGPPDDANEMLTNFDDERSLARMIIAVMLIEAVSIVFLAVLLNSTLKDQNKVIARWALGLWIIEAVSLTMRATFVFFLMILSREFIDAGSPDDSHFQTLGILFSQSAQFAYTILMVCYTIGGFMFYSLFFKSRYVPRALSMFGMAAVFVGGIGTFMEILGMEIPLVVFLPILPFEIAIGIWLMIKGVDRSKEKMSANTN